MKKFNRSHEENQKRQDSFVSIFKKQITTDISKTVGTIISKLLYLPVILLLILLSQYLDLNTKLNLNPDSIILFFIIALYEKSTFNKENKE